MSNKPQRGLPTPQEAEELKAEAARRRRELGLAPPEQEPAVIVADDAPTPPAPTPEVLSTLGEEELRARLAAAGLTMQGGGLQLLKPEAQRDLERIEPLPARVRRRIPKNRTGTYRNPYPRLDGKDTIKTSFNLDRDARLELDQFFARLGPQRRNGWAEQVLLAAARRTIRQWDRKALEQGAADDGDESEE
jgi:hypothetical protein